MSIYEETRAKWPWRPIRGCPGRSVLAKTRRPPREIVPGDLLEERHRCANARDPVIVLRFPDGGGLISFEQHDGYVHTLNTTEGLARKLAELQIG